MHNLDELPFARVWRNPRARLMLPCCNVRFPTPLCRVWSSLTRAEQEWLVNLINGHLGMMRAVLPRGDGVELAGV